MKKRQWLEDITGSMTHEEAAQKAGVERSTYTKAVNGYPVAIRTAKKIASAFGFDWSLFYHDVCDETGQIKVI